MKHLLPLVRFCHAVLLIAIIGTIASGCRDSVSISETTVEVPLSSLTVTPGTLQPAFSSNTTSYQVEVSTTVSTVTVTATPRDSTTTLSINGIDTNPGQGRPITLSASGPTTTITIVLTSQNGLESSYDILVRKVNNTLSALSVTPPGTFPPPGFNPNTLTYQVDVSSDTNSVTVVATKADSRAVMSGAVTAGAGVTIGQASIPLNGPGSSTEIAITVGIPNGETKTYRVTVKRAASGNNNLSALTVTPGLLNPLFGSGALIYTVNVATNITSVDVSATKADPNAVISGDLPNEGQATIQLDGPGTSRVISIIVTAQDTTTIKTYTITVNRAAASNADLSSLTITPPGSLPPPGFSPSTLSYIVSVDTNVASVNVSATKADPNAVISGDLPNEGQATIQLDGPGTSRVISIIVTAQDTTTIKTYTITVNRAAASNADLSSLTITPPGSLPPPGFSPSTLSYIVSVDTNVASVDVSATKADPNAVISGDLPNEGQATIQLDGPGTSRVISIIVTAQDTTTIKTYTITVNRAPAAPLFP